MNFIYITNFITIERPLRRRCTRCECIAMVVGSIPTRGNELFILLVNIFISALWHQGKSLPLSSATQPAMPRKTSAASGERNVLNTRFLLSTICIYSVKLILFSCYLEISFIIKINITKSASRCICILF